jgi:hypothetical protein
MTIPSWPTSFLADTASAYARVDRARAVEVAVAEILRPSLDFDRSRGDGDPLLVFATMLTALPRDGRAPLVAAITGEALRGILGLALAVQGVGGAQEGRLAMAKDGGVEVMARMLKAVLLVFGEVRRGEAGGLLGGCLERLDGMAGEGAGADEGRRAKRRRRSSGRGAGAGAGADKGLGGSGTDALADLARGVARALRADEEIRARWPDLRL